MIWIEIMCDGCSKLIVKGAKTPDGAEFIARQKGAVCDGGTHYCSDKCKSLPERKAA